MYYTCFLLIKRLQEFRMRNTIFQANSVGQVEAVFKTLSTTNGTLADGTTTCKNGQCRLKIQVTFTQPVPSPKG